jgi:hypothetical protein
MAPRFKPEALVLAVCLIALGVIWTLGNMGRVDTLFMLRKWWPVSLVLWGVLELVRSLGEARDRRTS